MRRHQSFLAIALLIGITGCKQNAVVKNESMIDSTLQATITDSLKIKLVEYDADDRRIIVMDIQN